MVQVLEILITCPKLTKLDISGNSITPAGEYIGKYLSSAVSLSYINISGTGMTDKELTYIMKGLCTSTVKTILLSNNCFTYNVFVDLLCPLLTFNYRLQNITCHNMKNMSFEITKRMFKSLMHNYSIRSINTEVCCNTKVSSFLRRNKNIQDTLKKEKNREVYKLSELCIVALLRNIQSYSQKIVESCLPMWDYSYTPLRMYYSVIQTEEIKIDWQVPHSRKRCGKLYLEIKSLRSFIIPPAQEIENTNVKLLKEVLPIVNESDLVNHLRKHGGDVDKALLMYDELEIILAELDQNLEKNFSTDYSKDRFDDFEELLISLSNNPGSKPTG